ncbi:hypothetical protein Tco_0073081 [Tanacetum coccineum]
MYFYTNFRSNISQGDCFIPFDIKQSFSRLVNLLEVKQHVSTSVKEIDNVQLGIVNQAERLQLEKHLGDFMFKSTKRPKGSGTEPNKKVSQGKNPGARTSTPVVDETHKEDQQATGGPPSLGVTNEEGADPQLSSGMSAFIHIEHVYSASFIFHSESASGCDVLADFTAEADFRKFAPHDYIPQQQDKTISTRDGLKTAHTNLGTNEESRSGKISKTIKLEDLSNLMQDTRSDFIDTDSPKDEPIIITDESEEEQAERYKDTHATSHDEPKDTSGPHPPSPKSFQLQELKDQPLYPNVNQLTDLLVTSLKPELYNLLDSHDFGSSIPTELKKLPSKIIELFGEVKELKKHVQDMEIKLPWDLKDILNKLETFTSTVPSLTSQSTPQTKGELIKKDKGKEVMSSKDAEVEETESDSKDDHANPADSMVETSNQKKLKKFSFVTKGGEQIQFIVEKIEEQKRIEESIKAELVKQEVKKKVQHQFFRYSEDQDHLHFSLCGGSETEDKTLAKASVQIG